MRLILSLALTALTLSTNLLFSEETSVSKALGSSLDQVTTQAKETQADLTKLAKEKYEVGKEKLKATTEASVEATKEIASNLGTKATGVLDQGKEKLQLLMDLGDSKSLEEAKTYVLEKLEGASQSEAVADLMKRGVKGLGSWLEKAKVEAGSTVKMKLAYYSRYVDEPAVANTLKKWMNEDSDPLVQEYCARALGYQSTGGVLDSLKSKLTQENLSDHVKKALESSISLLEPPETSTDAFPLPALPNDK